MHHSECFRTVQEAFEVGRVTTEIIYLLSCDQTDFRRTRQRWKSQPLQKAMILLVRLACVQEKNLRFGCGCTT